MTVTIENLYTGNGSTTDYSFTFPYLDTTDIKVTLATVATTAYSLLNATTVRFNSAPGNGVAIRIYRETAFDTPKATFYPGSAIRANDLNDNTLQNLYVNQESNNKVADAWLSGGPTITSSESWWTSDDTKVATTKAIENRIGAKIDTAMEADVLAGTDLSKTASGGQVTINHNVSGASSVNNSNGTVIQDLTLNANGHVTGHASYDLDGRYYTETELDAGQLDSRYYTETELNAGQLNNLYYTESELNAGQLDNRYYTETELTGGALDGRYFTETESDARYYRLGSAEEIQSGETWAAADNKVATTAAIDARITDLVDDVGGFVPIANETSFPNANPDVNNGAGTLVSIKALSSNLTSNGSGVATISNGTVGNSTVTINGLENSTTYGATLGMIVETTSTLNTYTFHRVTPKATEVTTVASNISNVNSVANNSSNINAAVSNASNINAAVSNASNINAAASNATNINTVAGNNTNINTVAGANSNISTVAGSISNVNNVGGSISNVNTVATNISSVNDFADRYRVASSAPSSNNDEGDLYFDTSANELKVYNGSAWQGGVTASGNLLSKSGDQMTGNLTFSGSQTVDGRDVSVDGAKLDGIETGATADQTNAEIRAAVEAATDSNVFTDADHVKLNGIEVAATADQTASEIRTLVESASDSNVFTDTDHTKLNGIETGATGDQTAAEIRTLVESASDSNVFTDADHSKLNGIEASATADQTKSDIDALNINADQVDGLHATSFLRSDADDTTSGHLTLSDSGYSIGNEYHMWKRDYVVSASSAQELLDKDGNSLPAGGAYRFHAHISGTGTDQSASAVYWNQNGTWKINVTYQSGVSSNHPEFIIDSSVPKISTDHASNYTIHVLAERLELGEGTGTDNRSGFGADAYLGVTGSNATLRYNPDGVGPVGSGNKIWHEGNDGAGTGLDADTLDGQQGAYYQNASNLNAGTVPDARFPATLPAVSGANLTNLPVSLSYATLLTYF